MEFGAWIYLFQNTSNFVFLKSYFNRFPLISQISAEKDFPDNGYKIHPGHQHIVQYTFYNIHFLDPVSFSCFYNSLVIAKPEISEVIFESYTYVAGFGSWIVAVVLVEIS